MIEKLLKDCIVSSKNIFALIHKGLEDSYFKENSIGVGGDRSLTIDLYAEDVYISYLKKYGKIISEESGEIGEGDYEIILDPIDGSDNLFSGFPYFGSSIALKNGKETIFSFIVNFSNGDFFIRGENFYKKGSLLNNSLIDIEVIERSKIGIFEKAYANSRIVRDLSIDNIKFRSPGAVALSLAYAYSVDFVLFVGKIREYDIAAGLHQCQDLNIFFERDTLLVSKNYEIFDKIKRVLLKDEV